MTELVTLLAYWKLLIVIIRERLHISHRELQLSEAEADVLLALSAQMGWRALTMAILEQRA